MNNEHPTSPKAILIDLGKCKGKQIKKLRKGKGKLMNHVYETIEELKASEAITQEVQPVIFVIKEKKRKISWSLW